jgi:hypothetical protein
MPTNNSVEFTRGEAYRKFIPSTSAGPLFFYPQRIASRALRQNLHACAPLWPLTQ